MSDKKESSNSTPVKDKGTSNNTHTILVSLLVIAGIGLIYRALTLKSDDERLQEKKMACVEETRSFTQSDNYARGILDKGTRFDSLMGFYKCNPIKRGDLVLFQISSEKEPVVKFVRAVSGDTFSVEKDLNRDRWNIKINDEVLKYLDRNYYFGRSQKKPLLMKYSEANNATLKPDDYILYSLVPPGIQDSGAFGPIDKGSIIGKVILPKKATK